MQNLRNNDTSVQESTLKIIAELLTDICEESTTTQDTNNGNKLKINYVK